MRRGRSGKAMRLAASVVGVVLVLLVLAQVFGPKIAASRISSRIGKYGQVQEVHVSAWPAVKLLFEQADSVRVHASRLRVTPTKTGELLREASGIDRLDVTVDRAREGPLALSEVRLQKRSREMSARAFVSEAAVKAALPPGIGMQLLGSGGGKVRVRASGGLFGVGASVEAVAEARDGRLVVHPSGGLAQALRLTLFSDPRVHVTGVSASRGSGPGGEAGYVLGIAATLR